MTNLTRSKSFTIIVRGQRQRALFLKSGNFLKQQLTCLEKSLGKGPVVQPCPVHLQNHAPCSSHLLVGYKKKYWQNLDIGHIFMEVNYDQGNITPYIFYN